MNLLRLGAASFPTLPRAPNVVSLTLLAHWGNIGAHSSIGGPARKYGCALPSSDSYCSAFGRSAFLPALLEVSNIAWLQGRCVHASSPTLATCNTVLFFTMYTSRHHRRNHRTGPEAHSETIFRHSNTSELHDQHPTTCETKKRCYRCACGQEQVRQARPLQHHRHAYDSLGNSTHHRTFPPN